ncbi:serine/threonine-protein kinase bud32 [Leucoagaricus gongylophorus]
MVSIQGPTSSLLERSTLISQGAEAAKALTSPHPALANNGSAGNEDDYPILIKYRFSKGYRHKTLDATLTKARIAAEARALIRCLRAGVNVPGVRMIDVVEGILGIEWIEGKSVRRLLPGGTEEEEEALDEIHDDTENEEDPLKAFDVSVGKYRFNASRLAFQFQLRFSRSNDDLDSNQPDLVLIDFGLSYQSALVEDKAVDLYVLERAFASTHPDSEPMFQSVLDAYQARMGKEWNGIKRRLNDVRLRGRKRSMVG